MNKYLSKIGSDHLWCSKNNQDYFLICDNIQVDNTAVSLKMVLDGCGSGNNSEVGSQLFSQLFNSLPNEQKLDYNLFENNVDLIMKKLLAISDSASFIGNNLFFTILCVFELEDRFITKVCGDGYVITHKGDNIEYLCFDNGEYPKYYLYNYLPENCRGQYTDGVTFETQEFFKTEYTNVGVATDGFRYVFDISDIEQYKLQTLLADKKTEKIEMLVNRNQQKFKDDVTICI